jgi:putative hydrolase of the HAD superfamily
MGAIRGSRLGVGIRFRLYVTKRSRKTITASPKAERMPSSDEGRAVRLVFIFDFGGVVIKWRNNNPIFDSIAERYGIPRAEMRRVFDSALPRLESGDVSMREFLEGALGQFGKRLRKGDSPDALWTLPFERLVKLRTGTVKLVESLRREGYQVYLFSNTSPPHARFLRRRGWDRLFDGFLSSCELGSMKPDATAYARALERIRAPSSQVVFIDDKEANVRGAKEFGIRWAFKFTSVARLRRDLASLPSRP